MIQRKQTLLLLLVTGLLAWCAFGSVKIGSYNEIGDFGGFSADVYANGHIATEDPAINAKLKNKVTWGYYAFASFTALAFITIFLFKKRRLQMQLCLLLMGLISATITYIYIQTGPQEYYWGIWVVVAAVFFLLLSLLFIRRDEKLVKSSSRFR